MNINFNCIQQVFVWVYNLPKWFYSSSGNIYMKLLNNEIFHNVISICFKHPHLHLVELLLYYPQFFSPPCKGMENLFHVSIWIFMHLISPRDHAWTRLLEGEGHILTNQAAKVLLIEAKLNQSIVNLINHMNQPNWPDKNLPNGVLPKLLTSIPVSQQCLYWCIIFCHMQNWKKPVKCIYCKISIYCLILWYP